MMEEMDGEVKWSGVVKMGLGSCVRRAYQLVDLWPH